MLLQGKKQDVLSAYAETSHVKSAVEAERKRSNFKEIELVNELTAISGFSLTVPQLASQQEKFILLTVPLRTTQNQ